MRPTLRASSFRLALVLVLFVGISGYRKPLGASAAVGSTIMVNSLQTPRRRAMVSARCGRRSTTRTQTPTSARATVRPGRLLTRSRSQPG